MGEQKGGEWKKINKTKRKKKRTRWGRNRVNACFLAASAACTSVCKGSEQTPMCLLRSPDCLSFLFSLPLKTRCPSSHSNHRSQERGLLRQSQGARTAPTELDSWLSICYIRIQNKNWLLELNKRSYMGYMVIQECELGFVFVFLFFFPCVCVSMW